MSCHKEGKEHIILDGLEEAGRKRKREREGEERESGVRATPVTAFHCDSVFRG